MTEATVQRRDELLTAAQRLFSQRGYEATSVRDIANALAIKAGSLYTHIETKEDLLWEILCRAAGRFFEAVQPIVDSNQVTVEKLRRLIAAHVRVITESASAAAVYNTEWRHLTEPSREECAAPRHAYQRIVR